MAAPAGHPFIGHMIHALWHSRPREPQTPIALGNVLLTKSIRAWSHGFLTVLPVPKIYQGKWYTKAIHPCGRGESLARLSACANEPSLACAVTTTFWTGSWVKQYTAEGAPGHRPVRSWSAAWTARNQNHTRNHSHLPAARLSARHRRT